MTRKLALAAALAAAIALVAVMVAGAATKKHHSASPVTTATNATYGQILVNAQGRTLYRKQGETTRHLACTGKLCLSVWPPVAVKSSSALSGAKVKGLAAFTRSDTHKLQVAYNGEPLYTFVSDHKRGDATGQNVNGFKVVVVKKKQAAAAPQQSAPAPSSSFGY